MNGRGRKGAAAAGVLAALLLAAGPARGEDRRQGTIEFFYGSYNLNEPLFKDIYQAGGKTLGVTVTARLFYHFDFYFSIKGFYKTGELSYTREKTTFFMAPVSVGIRFVAPTPVVKPYLGLGADIVAFFETNPIGTTWNFARGTHWVAGLSLQIAENFPVVLNAQIKSASVRTSPAGTEISLGGMEYGASFGFVF